MAKRTRLRKVPATTNNITKAVINFLISRGHFAFRVNTHGVQSADGTWKRSGSEKGVADVLACMRREGASGLFFAFEIKRGRDKMRKTQESFKVNVETSGGTYIVVKTYSDFLAWYTDSVFN
jgi:hypothetical protein